jgi:DNA-binding NarL/FixJ family response regulator
MEAVARGLTNKAIAKELWVTEQTVKFHLTNIYSKLDLSNRTELANWAFDHGLRD